MATKKSSGDKPQLSRVYSVAREFGTTTAELLAITADWEHDWKVTSQMQTLNPEQVELVRLALEAKGDAPAAKAPAKAKPKAAAAKKPAKAAPKRAKSAKSADKVEAAEAAAEPAAEKAEEAPAKPKRASRKKAADEAKDEVPAAKSKAKPRAKTAAKDKVEAAAEAPADQAEEKAAPAKPKRSTRSKAKAEDAAEAPAAKAAPAKPELTDDQAVEAGTNLLKDFLAELGLKRIRIEGSADKGLARFNLVGDEANTLLGRLNAGADFKQLDSLRSLIGQALGRGWQAQVDVNSFVDGRLAALESVTNRVSEFVANTGKMVQIVGINANDRRAIQINMEGIRGVIAKSEGYGVGRRLKLWRKESRQGGSDSEASDGQ